MELNVHLLVYTGTIKLMAFTHAFAVSWNYLNQVPSLKVARAGQAITPI
jgi:hypothetical protein